MSIVSGRATPFIDGAAHDVVIVGAGIAGLTAATRLSAAGHKVLVVEKGRGVGGRMATRRIGAARADHGAQFFTVRGDNLARTITDAGPDVVTEWCRGFGDGDGYPRYCGTDGMTRLAKWLASDIDVRTGETVVDLHDHPARAYLLTAPIPQSLAILSFSKLLPSPTQQQILTSVVYHPVIALMVVLSGPAQFPDPGAVQQPDDPVITFAADNQVKGISTVPAITLHASHDWSTENWERSDEYVAAELMAAAAPWLGSATATETSVQRWRYAGPVEPLAEASVSFGTNPRVVLAGDAFAGPKVEGAFNSGWAAADHLLDFLAG